MLWRLFHVKSLPIQPTGTSKPRFWKHSSTYKLSTSLQGNKWIPAPTQVNLTLSTLSWVSIFSILTCIHFCGANMENLFPLTELAPPVGDYYLYYHDLNV